MTLHEAESRSVETVNDPVAAPDTGSISDSALAEAARKVADNPDVQKALQAVVDLAMSSCNCHGASVTLVRADGGAETSATSSRRSRRPTTCSTRSTRVRACAPPNRAAPTSSRTPPTTPLAPVGPSRGHHGSTQRAEHPPVHRPPGARRAEPVLRDP